MPRTEAYKRVANLTLGWTDDFLDFLKAKSDAGPEYFGGLPSCAAGDMLYASATDTWSRLSKGTTAQYLKGGDTPSWATLNQAAISGLSTTDSPTFRGWTIDNTIDADSYGTVQGRRVGASYNNAAIKFNAPRSGTADGATKAGRGLIAVPGDGTSTTGRLCLFGATASLDPTWDYATMVSSGQSWMEINSSGYVDFWCDGVNYARLYGNGLSYILGALDIAGGYASTGVSISSAGNVSASGYGLFDGLVTAGNKFCSNADGTEALPCFYWDDDTDTGFRHVGADSWACVAKGADVLTFGDGTAKFEGTTVTLTSPVEQRGAPQLLPFYLSGYTSTILIGSAHYIAFSNTFGNSGYTALRAGSITGLSARYYVSTTDVDVTSISLQVRVNDVVVYETNLNITAGATWRALYITQARGVDTFSAGDWIALTILRTGGTSGDGCTIQAIMAHVEIYYD